MEKHIVKADGNGAIDVNGQVSPVIYTVSLKHGKGRAYEVDIRLMAPRDWLLRRGFERDACWSVRAVRAFPSITTMAVFTMAAAITMMAVSTLPTRSRSS